VPAEQTAEITLEFTDFFTNQNLTFTIKGIKPTLLNQINPQNKLNDKYPDFFIKHLNKPYESHLF